MTPRMTKSDAFRTDKKIVSLCNAMAGQYIALGLEKIGEYEGKNYWNCFDIYEGNGIRFFMGNGMDSSDNFSTRLMNDCMEKIRKLDSFSKDFHEKAKGYVREFCESIDRGIHDPTEIKSFKSFCSNLNEQKKFFPEMRLEDITKDLVLHYVKKTEVKDKISDGINSVIKKNPGRMNGKTWEESVSEALGIIHENGLKKKIKREHTLEM